MIEQLLEDSCGGKLTPQSVLDHCGKLAVCVDELLVDVRAGC